jgi:Adenylate kinase and related kinases
MTASITIDEAAAQLKVAERVLIIGCSGSGKSTLAQRLSERFNLRYISMDRDLFWLSGWQMRPRPEIVERLRSFVAESRWIMDGTSPGTLALRLPRSQLVIWMRPPRLVSLYGVISRWLRYRGRTRPEMAEGCPEKIDLDFLAYVWNFERTQSPEIEANLAIFGSEIPVLVLKSRSEIERLLAIIGEDH